MWVGGSTKIIEKRNSNCVLRGIVRLAITLQTRENRLKLLVILALLMDVTSPSGPIPAGEAQKKQRDTCERYRPSVKQL